MKLELIETAPNTFQAIEVKSVETIASDAFDNLEYWRGHLPGQKIVHGGAANQQREKATVLPWSSLHPLLHIFAEK